MFEPDALITVIFELELLLTFPFAAELLEDEDAAELLEDEDAFTLFVHNEHWLDEEFNVTKLLTVLHKDVGMSDIKPFPHVLETVDHLQS